MANMWTLGGLSLRELLRRTWSESWHDAVFGQAGRMAFYHFLAIFPSLLVFLAFTGVFPSIAPELKGILIGVVDEFLPRQASALVQQMLEELNQNIPTGFKFLSACAAALWASLNGTWALIYGLNTAYQVEEKRAWWKLAITIVGLTFALAIAGSVALLLLFSAAQIGQRVLQHESSPYMWPAFLRVLDWLTAFLLLSFAFAVVYRFAPNLRNHQWKWSTPGAVCALLLWVAATMGVRFYFQYISDYRRTYGHLNNVVMLLLWLYLTNGAILIGGEMNSEIEKAAAEHGNTERSGS